MILSRMELGPESEPAETREKCSNCAGSGKTLAIACDRCGMTEFEMKNGKRSDTRFSEGYFDLMVDWIKTKKINVPADSAVVYRAAAGDTPPSGPAVMDSP